MNRTGQQTEKKSEFTFPLCSWHSVSFLLLCMCVCTESHLSIMFYFPATGIKVNLHEYLPVDRTVASFLVEKRVSIQQLGHYVCVCVCFVCNEWQAVSIAANHCVQWREKEKEKQKEKRRKKQSRGFIKSRKGRLIHTGAWVSGRKVLQITGTTGLLAWLLWLTAAGGQSVSH